MGFQMKEIVCTLIFGGQLEDNCLTKWPTEEKRFWTSDLDECGHATIKSRIILLCYYYFQLNNTLYYYLTHVIIYSCGNLRRSLYAYTYILSIIEIYEIIFLKIVMDERIREKDKNSEEDTVVVVVVVIVVGIALLQLVCVRGCG